VSVVLKRYDLSGAELQQLARLERDDRVRARLMMIGYMCEGLSPDAAARAVGLRRASGYKWARRYEAEGVAGLSDRPRSGRPAKLDPTKAEAFKERVLDGAEHEREGIASLRGLDAQRILKQEFGADYGLSGTYGLIHRLQLSWLVSRPRHGPTDADRQAEVRHA
jgi:transposase